MFSKEEIEYFHKKDLAISLAKIINEKVKSCDYVNITDPFSYDVVKEGDPMTKGRELTSFVSAEQVLINKKIPMLSVRTKRPDDDKFQEILYDPTMIMKLRFSNCKE
jgi:hypothetical protein